MLDNIYEPTPVYGETAYLDDDEFELVGRTKGHRLAVISDDELSHLLGNLRRRCAQLRSTMEQENAYSNAGNATMPHKLEILGAAMQRASSEADRRNLRLAAADLNAFTEDVLGTDLDREPHRRGSAEKFVRTIGTAHLSEGKATATPPREK